VDEGSQDTTDGGNNLYTINPGTVKNEGIRRTSRRRRGRPIQKKEIEEDELKSREARREGRPYEIFRGNVGQ